jgi:hypothetical protein
MLVQFARSSAIAGLFISSTLIQTAAGQLLTRQDDCSDVRIFVAKGNNETEPGRQVRLVDAICSGLDNCDYEDVHFVKAYETVFCRSLGEGAQSERAQLIDYAERCP